MLQRKSTSLVVHKRLACAPSILFVLSHASPIFNWTLAKPNHCFRRLHCARFHGTILCVTCQNFFMYLNGRIRYHKLSLFFGEGECEQSLRGNQCCGRPNLNNAHLTSRRKFNMRVALKPGSHRLQLLILFLFTRRKTTADPQHGAQSSCPPRRLQFHSCNTEPSTLQT